jgi:hypothetical protein
VRAVLWGLWVLAVLLALEVHLALLDRKEA